MRDRSNLFLLAALVVVSGFWIHQRLRISDLEKQILAIEKNAERNPLPLRSEKPVITEWAKETATDVESGLSSESSAAVQPGLRSSPLEIWLAKIASLKAWIAQAPERQTPEIGMATEEEWLLVTYGNPLRTDADYKTAYRALTRTVNTRELRTRL